MAMDYPDASMASLLEDLSFAGHCDFDEACSHFLQTQVQTRISEAGLASEWRTALVDIITEAVHKVQAFTRLREDSMNITRYVKIVKLKWKDKSLTRFVSGVGFYHSVANRRMRQQISNPSLLLLETACGIGQEQRLVSMDTLLQQDEDYSKLFLKKVQLLQPSMVLVERGMVEKTLSELATNSITALLHVKRSVLDLLARVTKAKVLSSVDQAASSRKNVLGQGLDFSTRAVGERSLVLFKTAETQCLGGSLLLSSPDLQELRRLKPLLRSLLVSCRNSILEAELMQTMGLQAERTTLLDHYAASTAFQYCTACKFPCTSPQRLDIQFYLDGDSPLGLKLIRFCMQAGENCVCGEHLSSHTHTFLRNGGAVQLTKRLLTEETTKIEEKDAIYVRVLCKKCGDAVSCFTLTNFAWEYSFYKFIYNFFVPVQRKHKYHECEADFFREFLFIFTVQNVELQLVYHSKATYTLQPRPMHEVSTDELLTSLKFKGLLDLKAAGSEVVASLFTSISQVEEDLQSQSKPGFEVWRDEVHRAKQEVEFTLQTVQQLTERQLDHLLTIEAHRRALFLAVCKAKGLLENAASVLSSPNSKHRPQPSEPVGYLDDLDSPTQDLSFSLSASRFLHPKVASKKLDPLLRSRNFEYLQRGALTLPLCAGGMCVPVDEEDCMAILAYALSSNAYEQSARMNAINENLLNSEAQHLNVTFSTYEESDLTQAENKSELQQLYGPHITFRVSIYYSRQFAVLQNSLSHQTLIQSLCRSQASDEKTVVSHDQRLVAQLVDEKMFAMFINLAPNYFRYLYKCIVQEMPSVLVRTIGAYRISVKKAGNKRVMWVLLMENLTYGLRKPRLYSLQGGWSADRKSKEGKRLDLDFIEDFSLTPLILDINSKKVLDVAVWNDSRFLCKQNAIDYSLLLAVSDTYIRAGITDYAQQFTLDKAVESRLKEITSSDDQVVSPEDYRTRFRKRVTEDYFVGVGD